MTLLELSATVPTECEDPEGPEVSAFKLVPLTYRYQVGYDRSEKGRTISEVIMSISELKTHYNTALFLAVFLQLQLWFRLN